MINVLRRFLYIIRNHKHLVNMNDLTIGGNCGCCGCWVDKAIVTKDWCWTLCKKCEQEKRK